MLLPASKAYAEKVIFALADAITTASTDMTSKTVTYHRAPAARACLAMAAMMMNAKSENAPPLTAAEIEALVTSGCSDAVAELAKVMPAHVLESGLPGFVTQTLA